MRSAKHYFTALGKGIKTLTLLVATATLFVALPKGGHFDVVEERVNEWMNG